MIEWDGTSFYESDLGIVAEAIMIAVANARINEGANALMVLIDHDKAVQVTKEAVLKLLADSRKDITVQ